jgi:DNA-binding response OmpR family regulator
MAKILILTRDMDLVSSVRKLLIPEGHQVFTAMPRESRPYMSSTDLVLLDISPGQEDLFKRAPIASVLGWQPKMIVMLLNETQLSVIREDLVDFVLKPLREPELRARIRRLLSRQKTIENEIMRSGQLEIDVTNCDVTMSGKRIDLTFTEYQLLKYLVSHAGKVLTRDTILQSVWGSDYFGGDRTVDVHIQRLRGKIDDGQVSLIQTVRNIGYRFVKV